MFRNLRTIFSVSRLPLRIQARIARDPYASVHNVQRVRFVQPMLSRRRLLNTVLYGTAFVYGVVVFPAVALALLDDGEEEKDNKKDAEPSFINEEDDSIFIPLGLIHEAPSKPYKGTDPEWKEFVKFNREKESHKRLWGDLKQLTGKLVAGSYPLNQALGGSEVRVTQSWLNIEYPYRPPPEYERSGLEISDSHVAWTRRTIPPASYARLRKIMFPQPVSYSFLAALQVVWSSQVQTMKRRWGYEVNDTKSILEPVMAQKRVGQQRSSPGQFQEGVKPFTETQRPGDGDSGSEASGHDAHAASARFESSTTRNGIQMPSQPLPQASDLWSKAAVVFKKTFVRTWKPTHESFIIPRGCFLVTGLIEVQGSRATATMDVRASYNAKDRRWGQVSIQLRSFRHKHQAPLK